MDFFTQEPKIDPSVFLAQGVMTRCDVTIGRDSNIWFNVVMRGDIASIVIGERTNVQDLTMVHVSGNIPCKIGNDVTIGHSCIIHACEIGNNVLVGMGSVILDGAVVEDNVLIAAGSVVTPRTRIPAGKKVMGHPAKIVGDLTPEDIEEIHRSAQRYVELAKRYKNELSGKRS